MARAPRKAKSATSVKVNFKDVESRQTPPEGDYKLKVLEAVNEASSSSGDDMIKFILEISTGKYKGTKLGFYCPLAENSLWKLHAFLTALGVEVPQDEMEIDLAELIDLEIVGVLTHETYQGKKRAKMTDFDSIENYKATDGDEDEADEKPKKGKKEKAGKKSKKSAPEPILAADVEAMDRDELEALIESHGLDDVDADDKKLKKDEKLLAAVLEALEEADLIAEPEKKGKDKKADKKKKKKVEKVDKSDVEDMDADELQALVDEHDLSVDIEGMKLKKAVKAVIEALDDADLLEDDD